MYAGDFRGINSGIAATLPPMKPVQLSQSERAQVYLDPDTKRVLGFGPEGAVPLFPLGTRYTTQILYHARDIERFADRYREQCFRDSEEKTLASIEREAPIRKAIRDAILERNKHVDERNKAKNLAMLKVMDHFYEKTRAARQKMEVTIAAERYEAGTDSIDVAKQSPYWKEGR